MPTASLRKSKLVVPSPLRFDLMQIVLSSAPGVVQIVLATAHPAKFNAAVAAALVNEPDFDFERDIMPPEFDGLLEKKRRIIECEGTPEAVKAIVSREVHRMRGETAAEASADMGGASV